MQLGSVGLVIIVHLVILVHLVVVVVILLLLLHWLRLRTVALASLMPYREKGPLRYQYCPESGWVLLFPTTLQVDKIMLNRDFSPGSFLISPSFSLEGLI